MRCVVDASVALKWFFQSAPDYVWRLLVGLCDVPGEQASL